MFSQACVIPSVYRGLCMVGGMLGRGVCVVRDVGHAWQDGCGEWVWVWAGESLCGRGGACVAGDAYL